MADHPAVYGVCPVPGCGEYGLLVWGRWCRRCNSRWKHRQRPGASPGPARWRGGRAGYEARLENLSFLISVDPEMSQEQAACRMGVNIRSITRYTAELARRGQPTGRLRERHGFDGETAKAACRQHRTTAAS